MTWPASLTLVTVTHSPVIGGQKPAGHVRVEPASRMWATADGASVLPAELELVPVVDGTYTFQVPAVDDPELTGADLTYWVTELFPGGSRRLRIAPTLAHAAAPVDLYEVLTDAPIPGGTQAFIDQVQASLTSTIGAEVDAKYQEVLADPNDATVRLLIEDSTSGTRQALDDQMSTTYAGLVTVEAMQTWLPKQAAPRHQVGKLTDWQTALANRNTTKAQVVVIGDSISEGSDAGSYRARWVNVLQDILRDRLSVSRGAEFPFIPAMEAASPNDMPVTVAGNVTMDQSWGLGWRTAKLLDATSKLTFTFEGTSAELMYVKASATGVLNIVVDGGTPAVVDTNANTAGGASDAALWSTGALTAGTHTVVVTRDPSSAGTNAPYVEGLLTYNGDETTGLRVIDASHSGFRSANFTTITARTAAKAVMAAGGAGLVVIAMGTNDTLYDPTQTEYKANVQRMIDALRTGGYAGSFLLVHWYETASMAPGEWAPYGQSLAALAATDPKIAYLDMTQHMPSLPSPYNDPSALGLYSGNVHPNANGHTWIAQTLTSVLNIT